MPEPAGFAPMNFHAPHEGARAHAPTLPDGAGQHENRGADLIDQLKVSARNGSSAARLVSEYDAAVQRYLVEEKLRPTDLDRFRATSVAKLEPSSEEVWKTAKNGYRYAAGATLLSSCTGATGALSGFILARETIAIAKALPGGLAVGQIGIDAGVFSASGISSISYAVRAAKNVKSAVALHAVSNKLTEVAETLKQAPPLATNV